jgi:hypothetical protein
MSAGRGDDVGAFHGILPQATKRVSVNSTTAIRENRKIYIVPAITTKSITDNNEDRK